jgi:predicted  nucleic acid-binding Zn-ribbon protein
LQIGEDTLVVERRWQDVGAKTKVIVNDAAHDVHEFRKLLLDRLGIPAVHYPQGNPYGPRTWPELGWRSLFRHLYRRQRFWGDIADQQFASEQHACLIQFLGMAETLFSKQYGEMIQNEKSIAELQVRKEQFLKTLQEVSNEIVDEHEIDTAITPDALKAAKVRLEEEVNKLNGRRAKIVAQLISNSAPGSDDANGDTISKLSKEFAELRTSEGRHAEEITKVQARLDEISLYDQRVSSEIGRLERAKDAGETLADLKVTHCPVCDQAVDNKNNESDSGCYLCHQQMPSVGPLQGEPLKRLEFELDQLSGEKKEISELLASLQTAKQGHIERIRSIRARASQISELLRPARMATAAVLPPEVAQIEMEVGRRIERIDQLRRIGESLAKREKLASEIQRIQKQVEALKSEVDRMTADLDFETAGDILTDGMNDYVRQLVYEDKKMWTQQSITFRIGRSDFSIKAGKQKWQSQLGGTMTIYFLLAYHYALLELSKQQESKVPGFLILDLPAEVEGEKVADKENFVIEPFIALTKQPEFNGGQIIVAGSAFQGLGGVRRIELKEVWKG